VKTNQSIRLFGISNLTEIREGVSGLSLFSEGVGVFSLKEKAGITK